MRWGAECPPDSDEQLLLLYPCLLSFHTVTTSASLGFSCSEMADEHSHAFKMKYEHLMHPLTKFSLLYQTTFLRAFSPQMCSVREKPQNMVEYSHLLNKRANRWSFWDARLGPWMHIDWASLKYGYCCLSKQHSWDGCCQISLVISNMKFNRKLAKQNLMFLVHRHRSACRRPEWLA